MEYRIDVKETVYTEYLVEAENEAAARAAFERGEYLNVEVYDSEDHEILKVEEYSTTYTPCAICGLERDQLAVFSNNVTCTKCK